MIDDGNDLNTKLSWYEEGENPSLNMPMPYTQRKQCFGKWSFRQDLEEVILYP